MRAAAACLALGLLAGCGDDPTGADGGFDAGARPDAGALPDAGGRDAGTVALPDAGPPAADAGGPDGGGPDGGAPVGDVRFIAMGDTGEGNAGQIAVAAAVQSTCAAETCDFVMLLGDNIYDSGVSSVTDPQWMTKFEGPYAALSLPFYPVLGNHDYGGVLFGSDQGGLGNEFDKGSIAVAYTASSTRWTLPATFHTFQLDHVGFVMLDTNSILWDDTTNGDQRAWIRGAIADLRASGATWIVAAGHHPLRSNGAHGNAGSYEAIEIGGVDIPIPVPIMDGRNVRSFFQTYLCGEVDVIFAGHDHNRQWLDEPTACAGTELIVSGAGSKTKSFSSSTRNALHFGDDSTEGFMYVRIQGDTFYGRMVDRDGNTQFERMITR